MSLGKKHHLTATDAYELEGFIMEEKTNVMRILEQKKIKYNIRS